MKFIQVFTGLVYQEYYTYMYTTVARMARMMAGGNQQVPWEIHNHSLFAARPSNIRLEKKPA